MKRFVLESQYWVRLLGCAPSPDKVIGVQNAGPAPNPTEEI